MSKALARWRVASNVVSKPTRSFASTLNLQRAAAAHAHKTHITRSYSSTQRPPVQEHTEPHESYPVLLSQLSDLPELAAHLNETFAPLEFSPELAARILTHPGHKHASISSNSRLSFIGRRVLQSYLMLFLNSSPDAGIAHSYETIVEKTLNTYILGEFVAPKWGLPPIMKWRPIGLDSRIDRRDAHKLGREAAFSIGLYKASGTAVEALVGGVFHHYGGNVAHRLFHTRLLPHVLLPGRPDGLHDSFHGHALKICKQLGGQHGNLLDSASPETQSPHSR
ncbi:hypothetical protein BDW22DRAFT_1366032 [Trametopsis cervina]|nr:hypothetical protein BDW22DRAFT_1366032 [Trametopsis cervina]